MTIFANLKKIKLTLESFKKNKIGILIAARSNSKRLPGKHFLYLNKKKNIAAIDLCILRLKRNNFTNKIIICTTDKKEDQKFLKFSKKHKIGIFFGDERNVIKRYIECARKNKLEHIVRITGDCPLIDFKILNRIYNIYKTNEYDYVSNVNPPTYPDGLDVEIFSLSSLVKSYKLNKSLKNKEHVTFFMRKSKLFKKKNVLNRKNLSATRWTLDNFKDLILIRKIINLFDPNLYFSYSQIIKYKKFIKNN